MIQILGENLGPLISRAIELAVNAVKGPAVKQMAITVGVAVTAEGMRAVAEAAEDKIDELEARGSISPNAAAVASRTVRVVSVSSEIATAAIGSAAGSAIEKNGSVRIADAICDAAKNPGATGRTYAQNTANPKVGSWKWVSTMRGYEKTARYLTHSKDDKDG